MKSSIHIYIYSTMRMLMMVVLSVMVACKPSVPNKYIQPKEMENILYEYHLIDAFSSIGSQSGAVHQLASQQMVLKKYGVTQAEFDSSMVYYFRHTERLHSIYENLAKRLSEESKSIGGKAMNDYTALSAKGDTANIWQGSRSEILLPTVPDNKFSFVVKADTSFHPGDRVLMNFKSLFVFQDGVKDAMCVLSVRFKNDSIATQEQHLSSNGYTSLKIEDTNRVGIKEIGGYVVLVNTLKERSQTYKLLSVYDIQLIRMHVKPETAVSQTEQDGSQMLPGEVPDKALSQESQAPSPETLKPSVSQSQPVRSVPVNPDIEQEPVRVEEVMPHDRRNIQPRRR